MGGIVSKPKDISIPSNNYLSSSNVSLGVSHTFPFPFFIILTVQIKPIFQLFIPKVESTDIYSVTVSPWPKVLGNI